jgi:hypothetical protein
VSALWAPAPSGKESAPAPEVRRPTLRAVPRAKPRLARVPFILVLIAIFGAGMTGLLMLNTTLQNQAFQASTLNRQATELTYTQADLESQLDKMAAPQVLAQRATALGLRANPHPAFLVLPKGKVVGKPQAVSGNEVPTLIVKTPAELAAERVAADVRKKQRALERAAEARAKAARDRAEAAQKKIDDARKAAEAKRAAAAKQAAAQEAAAKKAAARQAAAKKAAAEQAAARRAAAAKQAAAKKAAEARPTAKKPGGRG